MDNIIKKIVKIVKSDPDRIKTDSRDVKEGDIYVAIKGTRLDGNAYVDEALDRGAELVLCENNREDARNAGRIFVVDNTKEKLADIAKAVHDDPSSRMRVHGITGTNGKTTTAFLIFNALRNSGVKAGMIGTVYTVISEDARERSRMTTPGTLALNEYLGKMVRAGDDAAVMEISSHALCQGRVTGIGLDSAVFTNITPEHLDYHGDMDEYFSQKKKIFGLLKPSGAAFVNMDDPLLRDIRRSISPRKTIGFSIRGKSDIYARGMVFSDESTEFEVCAEDHGNFHISSRLIGAHNVYNIMAAAAVLLYSGMDPADVREGIEKTTSVPGRLEKVESKAGFSVFVDYAHTPDALKNTLSFLRSMAKARLICVFGCGGDRDKGKRPVMGGISSEFCDVTVITNDNPRMEDPLSIMRQIEKGMSGEADYSIIPDRGEAIKTAVAMAEVDDIILIAGKGHETYQIIGDKVFQFDDAVSAGKALKEMGYA